MKKTHHLKWALVAVWLGCWIYRTRYAMLDDALIHLRYAGFLKLVHHITYDGVTPSFGTSSLLYVSLLALLQNVTSTVFLPKIVSCISYLLLIGVLLSFGKRFAKDGAPYYIWLGMLLSALSPMGLRWLTDGMETSTVVLAVVLLSFAASREMTRVSASWLSPIAFGLGGLLLVLLRIELASLAILTTCTILAGIPLRDGSPSLKRHLAFDAIALSLGALLTVVGTRLVFGSFLPDTALAKSSSPSLAPLVGMVFVILSSVILGISSLLLSFGSAALLLRELVRQRAPRLSYLAWACANASFPLIGALTCLRGQSIQGIRYILWPLFFSALWNAFEWERVRQKEVVTERERLTIRSLTLAYSGFLFFLLFVDWHLAVRAMTGRAHTFQTMREAGLDQFRNKTVIAGDVGFIGYFTGASVCDMDGLVNGRAAARNNMTDRIAACVKREPLVLFVTASQAQKVHTQLDFSQWTVCQEYNFTNATGDDRHYLIVPRPVDAHPCPGPAPAASLGTADKVLFASAQAAKLR